MTTNTEEEDIFLTPKQASEMTGYSMKYLSFKRYIKEEPIYYKNTKEKFKKILLKKSTIDLEKMLPHLNLRDFIKN